jgi:hypothetical protein
MEAAAERPRRKEFFMFSSSRRKIGVLLLTLALLAPWNAAAEQGARSDQLGTRTPWELLARLWNTVVALWGEAGCSMDPYGDCGVTNPPPAENLDEGCSVDPYGDCRHSS